MNGSLAVLFLVHVSHVAAGLVWLGGQAMLVLAVWPALGGRGTRAEVRALGANIGRLLGISGGCAMLLGLVRAIWSPLHAWSELVTTAYGVTLLTAIVLTVALAAHGGRLGRSLDAALAGGTDTDLAPPEVIALARRGGAVGLAGGAVVLACMVLMHFGL